MALMMEEKYDDLADLRERAKAEVSKVVIGQDRTVELLLIAAVAHGHVLLEGPPGSAKTLLARAVAHMLGASFKRIQFTSDTTPTELNGQNVVRAGEQATLADLRDHLKKLVPNYMMPARWTAYEALPKNANGKIDRPRLKEAFARNEPDAKPETSSEAST